MIENISHQVANMMDPVVASFNGHQLRYFGILVALGWVILFFVLRSNLKQAKIWFTREELLDWMIIVFLYGVIGARVYYVALNFDYYFSPHAKWYEFLAIWRGGFALNGGVFLAAVALAVLSRQVKPKLEQLTDQIVPPLFLVQVFGAVGSFINGESYGGPTDHVMGYIFRYGPASKRFAETPLHPVMLYQAGLCLISFFILNLFRISRFRDGFTTVCALLCYSGIGFFVGLMRVEKLTILGQDESIMFGFFGILVSLGLILGKRLYRKLPSPHKQFPSTRKWSL